MYVMSPLRDERNASPVVSVTDTKPSVHDLAIKLYVVLHPLQTRVLIVRVDHDSSFANSRRNSAMNDIIAASCVKVHFDGSYSSGSPFSSWY